MLLILRSWLDRNNFLLTILALSFIIPLVVNISQQRSDQICQLEVIRRRNSRQ